MRILSRCSAAMAIVSCPLLAQPGASPQTAPLTRPVPGRMRAQLLAANVGLGALVGGLRALVAQRPIRRGVLYGASGGAISGAGRQLVGTRRALAGVSGRAVHDLGLGVGTMAVRDTLELPMHIRPLVARWRPSTRQWPRVRVNVTNLVTSIAFLRDPAVYVDWNETLWSGALVVAQRAGVPDNSYWGGSTWPGTIRLYGDLGSDAERRLLLAHESIHVLQLDAMHEWLGHDAESRALRQSRAGRAIARWVEPGALGALVGLASRQGLPYTRSPLEIEAWWLADGRPVLGPP